MGRQIKRLSNYNEIGVNVSGPFSEAEILARHSEYETLSPEEFKKKYKNYSFKPAIIEIEGKKYEIQVNHCCSPFCKWFGLPQKRYVNLRHMPSRYKFVSARSSSADRLIACNDVPDLSISGFAQIHYTSELSNWSIAEEIKRLIKINSVAPLKDSYVFHNAGCTKTDDPFVNQTGFYRKGKTTAGSEKYQCKECKKITCVLPTVDKRFNYNQKLDGMLFDFAKDIIARAPVRRTCEKLGIASGTYYSKLEILYKRCLEFLEVHETEEFKKLHFNEIVLCSDSLVYHLNNLRIKGAVVEEILGSEDDEEKAELKFQTKIIATADVRTGYVFRADAAYDFDFDLFQLAKDTNKYHCDRSYTSLRKNQRLVYTHYPKDPGTNDVSDILQYESELAEFENRLKYVPGSHVTHTYTAIAHHFLLKQLINSDKWYLVTDDDNSFKTAIFRSYKDECKAGDMHYFTCQADKNITLAQSRKNMMSGRKELNDWAEARGFGKESVMSKARMYLVEYFSNNEIYEHYPGSTFLKRSLGPIISPLASISEGKRDIDFLTDTTAMGVEDLARIVAEVSSITVDNFFQELRRRVSILERPLVTARGKNKSYIYANGNPKYAQYMVTIFRTFYNFCWTKNTFGRRLTPAQKIGLTDKVYTIKDIIYFK